MPASEKSNASELAETKRRIAELEEELRVLRAERAGADTMLRTLLESAPDFVYFKDHERRFLRASRSFEQLFGCPLEEIIGKRDEDLFPPEIATQTVEDDLRVLGGESILNQLEGGDTGGGEEHWVLTTKLPWRDPDGTVRGLFGISREITDHKLLEDALRLSEKRLKLAQRVAGIGHWSLDVRTNAVDGSDELFRLFGRTRDEGVLGAFMAAIHPGDLERVQGVLQMGIAQGKGWDIEYRLLLPDGEVRMAHGIGEALLDASGETMLLFGTVQDISDRHRATEERLDLLRRLSATIAHEIRNPLGTIQNSVEVLRSLLAAHGQDQHKALLRVERNVERCDHIIDDLLDFTRVRAPTLVPTEIDSWMADFVDEQPIPADIQVRVEMESGALVLADSEKIRQVMVNLVTNACEAMAEVEGRRRVLGVSTRRGEATVEVRVTDTGSGIAPDHLERIFEPLFSTKSFGIGLGLAIAKDVVNQHGTELRAHPGTSGVGTVFMFELPISGDRET